MTVSTFLNDFNDYLEVSCSADKNIVICGDFNIHLNDAENNEVLKFIDLLNTFGLSQKVNTNTHTSGNTLDLILSRSNDDVIITEPISEYFISDHCFVTCDIDCPKPDITRKTVKFRKIAVVNNVSLAHDLRIMANSAMDIDDVN